MRFWGKPLPMLLGFAGAAAAAWGLYHLMLIGSCSTPPSDGLPACPPGSERYFFAVFLGLFTAIPSVAFGGGALPFMGIFVSIAVAGISAARTEAGPDWLYFFGLCFLIGPVLMVATVIWNVVKGQRGKELVSNGIEAVGTVLSVQDTGVTINMNPRLTVRFRIEPLGGYPPPFEAEKTSTVQRFAMPRVGDRYPVWIDPTDLSTWGWASSVDATAPHGVRRLWEYAKNGGPKPPAPIPLSGQAPDHDAIRAELVAINDARARGVMGEGEFASRIGLLVSQLTQGGAALPASATPPTPPAT